MFLRRLFSAPVIIGAILVVLVGIAGGFITNPTPIDSSVLTGFIDSRSAGVTTLMNSVGVVFDPNAIAVMAVVAGLIVWRAVKKILHGIFVMGSVALSAVNAHIIKALNGRPRPPEITRLAAETSPSFPSGHTTAITAFLAALVLVLTMTRWGRRLRHLLWIAALAFIVFIAVSRLYLGVHWLTDVLGGFGIGLGSTMILAPFLLGPNVLRRAF